MGEIFSLLFTNPITNVLVGFYKLLSIIGVPYALGFSIILLTAVIKLILWPFVSLQIKSAAKMQKMTPHMNEIKEKHKDDKKKQQEAIMMLYKEHGVNPAAGCLPLIIQIPVIWSLYGVLTNVVAITSIAAINKINAVLYFPFLHLTSVWDPTFLGFSLAASPATLLSVAPIALTVPLITGVLQFILSKMMLPEEMPKTQKDDFQSAFQKQSLFIFPIMIGFFSYSLPIGLSLYWNTFTVFGILQQYLLIGPGGTKNWITKAKTIYGRNK